MMDNERLPHIITATSFVIFIVLGLACATVEPRQVQQQGLLGVMHRDPEFEYRQALGLGLRKGTLVFDYFFGSPADRAGLRAGDFIVAINGREVDSDSAPQVIRSIGSGSTAVITIIRDGVSLDITATLGSWSDEFFEDSRFR